MNWKPIETAPFDGTTVLLYHQIHGIIQGWFDPMVQYETMDGTEFDGDVWVLGDDIVQEPVERYPHPEKDDGSYFICCGPITHWDELPKSPEECEGCLCKTVEDAPKNVP